MSTIAFLPWTTATERIECGNYYVIPFAEAVATGLVPAEDTSAVETILKTYDHPRPVDRADVALIGRVSRALTEDMSSLDIAAIFDFQTRLAATSVASREYFGVRYWSSESLNMVVQTFSVQRAGSTVITHRRRDGHTSTIIPKGARPFRRPLHVSSCELPQDADIDLLVSVDQFVTAFPKEADAVQDALSSFALGNKDSPDIHAGAELVHLIGALSALVGEWSENGLVPAVLSLLPAGDGSMELPGPIASHPKVAGEPRSVRETWLRDAYRLRGQYAHGRVHTPPYKPIWGLRAHLLLATQVFALALKGKLVACALYTYTEHDLLLLDALDSLCTQDPFGELGATVDRTNDEDGPSGVGTPSPWRDVLDHYSIKRYTARVTRDFGPAVGESSDGSADAPPTPG